MGTIMKKNLILLWIRDALSGISGAFGSAAIIQGFLLHAGLSEEKIGIYVTFGTIVNFIASLGLSGAASATNKTVKISSFCFVLTGLVNAAYILPTLIKTNPSELFILVMAVTGLSSIVLAVKNIFEYKLPCEVINADVYAKYISVSGIVSGVVGLGCGVLITFLYRSSDFDKISVIVFLISSFTIITAGILNVFLKTLYPVKNTDKKKQLFGQFKVLFSNRDFRILLLPNFLRGFGAALISLAAVLAVKTAGFREEECAVISSLASAGMLISCAVYLPMIRKCGRALTAFLGAAVFSLVIPAFLFESRPVFIVLYGIAYVGYNVTCNAIPDLIYRHISADLISPFQTWRIAILTLGTTAGTSLFGFMLARVSPVIILFIGVFGYFVCGTAYYIFYRKMPPAEKR